MTNKKAIIIGSILGFVASFITCSILWDDIVKGFICSAIGTSAAVVMLTGLKR